MKRLEPSGRHISLSLKLMPPSNGGQHASSNAAYLRQRWKNGNKVAHRNSGIRCQRTGSPCEPLVTRSIDAISWNSIGEGIELLKNWPYLEWSETVRERKGHLNIKTIPTWQKFKSKPKSGQLNLIQWRWKEQNKNNIAWPISWHSIHGITIMPFSSARSQQGR